MLYTIPNSGKLVSSNIRKRLLLFPLPGIPEVIFSVLVQMYFEQPPTTHIS